MMEFKPEVLDLIKVVSIWAPLAMLTLLAAIFNVLALRPQEWKLDDEKNFWQRFVVATMIGLPVLNWSVAITTVIWWWIEYPKDA